MVIMRRFFWDLWRWQKRSPRLALLFTLLSLCHHLKLHNWNSTHNDSNSNNYSSSLSLLSFFFLQTDVTCLLVWKTAAYQTQGLEHRPQLAFTVLPETQGFISAVQEETEEPGVRAWATRSSGFRWTLEPTQWSPRFALRVETTRTNGWRRTTCHLVAEVKGSYLTRRADKQR